MGIKDLLEGIDKNIRQASNWTTCNTHYRYHISEKVTPSIQITQANDNQDF
jgi:hypothetical protein